MIHVEKAPEDIVMSDELYELCVIRAIVEHARDKACNLRQAYSDKEQHDIADNIKRAYRHLTAAADILDEAYAKQKENEECTP